MSETNGYRVIGTRPVRHDGVEKVTGQAVYSADIKLPGMLYAAVLRSPHAHARILSIDTSPAEQMPGVQAVMTSRDLPDLTDTVTDLGEGAVNMVYLAQNVLAHDKALYRGHAVAAVAATTREMARAAADAIVVEYEPLPPVMTVRAAMADDAVLLHEDLKTDSLSGNAEQPSNISRELRFEKGDAEAAFAECDIVVEREFDTAAVHQGYIEPHCSTANWTADGHVKVWTATQGAFTCRQQTADLLKIPTANVTVVPCEIGGGFGGKIAVYLEPLVAWLSRETGRPVQISMTREEVFVGTGPTPASWIRVKLGANQDGRLIAGSAWMAYDSGAFPGGFIAPGSMCIFSCYDLEHATVQGFDVVTNTPKTQAYRAPGSTQAAFACECVVDEICDRLEMDPIEFRIRNAAKEGVERVDGLTYPRVGLIETLEALRDSPHLQQPLEGAHRGRGVACGFWFNAGLKSCVSASVNSDGSVSLVEGSTDIGGTRTSIAMQLAEELGLEASDVHPRVADTDGIGYTDVTGGSRVTFATGLAAIEAARKLKTEMIDRAARHLGCQADDVVYEDQTFRAGDQAIEWKELAGKLEQLGNPVAVQATVSPNGATHAFGAHAVDLEVDPETGKVTILRYTVAQDAGRAIHPSYVEGQMQGGVVQGIGWALNEEYWFDDAGQMRNASFLDYRMPTSLDLPPIETVIVEVNNPDHPYGVRGVGEVPIVPPPAAIARAIQLATGIRLRRLPMSPPKVWEALNSQGT